MVGGGGGTETVESEITEKGALLEDGGIEGEWRDRRRMGILPAWSEKPCL